MLVPKCVLCVAAYASALGALGLSPAAHARLVEPLVALGVATSFGLVLALSARRRDVRTPAASAAGAVLILAGRYLLELPVLTALGALLLVAAALVNAAQCRKGKREAASPSAG